MKTQSKTGTIERNSLEGLFRSELTEIYYAQQQLGGVYKRMGEAAQSEELKKVFEQQAQNTALQVTRMDECFGLLELTPDSEYADIAGELAAVADEMIADFPEGPVRDAALIAAAQKIEHYGISTYGTLRTMATILGRVQCASLLEENKDEEAETDGILTRLATTINQAAFEQG
jgi:ferritin-like metal-binding protein YciE